MSAVKWLEDVIRWIRSHPLGRRLRRRLLIWFCVFSLVPLVVTNTVGYVESQRIIERLVYDYLNALAEVEARHVREDIDRQDMALAMIAAGNEFLAAGAVQMAGGSAGEMGRVASHTAMREYLTKKLHELPSFEALRLYSADGRVLVTAARESSARSDIPGSSRAGFFVVPPRWAHEPPRFHSVVALQRGGANAGYLGGIIGAPQLKAFLELPDKLGGIVHSIVLDELGRPLYVSGANGTVDYLRPHPVTVQSPGATHTRYTNRFGERLIASGVTVPGTQWTFVTEVPESAAFGPLRALRRTSFHLEVIFVVLLALFAWFVARSIVRPVRDLVSAARRVASGDLQARVPVNQNDELGELAVTFNEMTAALADASARVRQLHQQQIERAEQLATVGELASGVAHEIKNPVTGISNGLDLVQRRIGPDPVLAPIMDEMTRQIARIDSAVKDLLSFARPSKPTLAPVDSKRIVQRALRLVEPAAANAGLVVEVHCAADMPTVLLDEELIAQALVNMLMNAVQATAPGGRIIVRTRALNDSIQLVVHDTGKGITPEDLEHIYKPFFTTRHSGTGLGLSITRDTIEQHGGRIRATSQVGRGTTFTITLPLRTADEPQPTEYEVTV